MSTFKIGAIVKKESNGTFDAFPASYLTNVEVLVGKESGKTYLKANAGDKKVLIMPADIAGALALQIAANGGSAEGIKFPAALTADGKLPKEGDDVSIHPKALYKRTKDGVLTVTN